MRKLKWSIVLGILAAVIVVGTALALPPQVDPATVPPGLLVSGNHVEDAPLWSFARVFSGQGGVEVFTGHGAWAPGQSSGWHFHPGPNIHTVVSGTMTAYNAADCAPHTYGPGQGFIDPGYGNVHIGRNEGSVPLHFYVTFLNPAGNYNYMTAAPAPSNCPTWIK